MTGLDLLRKAEGFGAIKWWETTLEVEAMVRKQLPQRVTGTAHQPRDKQGLLVPRATTSGR